MEAVNLHYAAKNKDNSTPNEIRNSYQFCGHRISKTKHQK